MQTIGNKRAEDSWTAPRENESETDTTARHKKR